MGRSTVLGVTAAVFGCTGFIGRYLVNKLGKNGVKVVAVHRGDEYDVWPLRQMGDLGHIEPRRVHLRHTASIDRALEGCHLAINLIAQDRPSWNFTMQQANVDGAVAIADACRRAHCQLLHVSSLAARSGSKSAFLASKYEGEVRVRERHPAAVIVRPGAVFGLEDRLVNALDHCAMLPLGMPYPVYVGDVAEGIYQIIHAKTFAGTTFDFSGYPFLPPASSSPEQYTWMDLVEWFRYYSMKKHHVWKMQSPLWLSVYSRIGVEWRRPFFTPDLARAWAEHEVLSPQHATFRSLGMTDLATLDRMAALLTRFMRPQANFDTVLAERAKPGPQTPTATE